MLRDLLVSDIHPCGEGSGDLFRRSMLSIFVQSRQGIDALVPRLEQIVAGTWNKHRLRAG